MIKRNNIGKHPLAEYDWNEKTGRAVLTYVTRDAETRLAGPDLVVVRDQPMNPRHHRWSELGHRPMVAREDTGIIAMIGERCEAQIEGVDRDWCWQYI